MAFDELWVLCGYEACVEDKVCFAVAGWDDWDS